MAHSPNGVSSAKTTRPGSSAVFHRERLFRVLDSNRSAACTWITGPPGAGKTALMASFVLERGLPCLWYQIDADDADPSAFFAYLAGAAHASLGAPVMGLPRFSAAAAFSVPTFARQFFRELFAAVPSLVIVLDDYHEVDGHGPLHDIVHVAIEQTPAGAHIAVASRKPPPPVLARCQANGAVRSMSWDQLALTQEEVIGIASAHGVALDERAGNDWRQRCGGWATGLGLLLQPDASPAARLTPAIPPTLLFDYLDQEVFQGLPEATRSALLHLAFLPRIPADLVNELVGSPTAERQLAAMAEGNLFTTVSLDGQLSYRFHPLFRDFLVHRAKRDLPADEFLARHHRAAAALESRGLVEEAAHVLLAAKAWDRLGELTLAHAPALMTQGRHMTLDRWLAQLPAAQVEASPWLLYWRGACRSLHDPFTARASLEAAHELFASQQDRAGVLLAWSGVVDCIFRIYSDLRQLDAWIVGLEELLRADAQFPSAEIEARVTFSMFVALSFRQPQHVDLPVWRQRLVGIAAVAPDPLFRLMSRFQLTVDRVWQGDLCGAQAELGQFRREAAHHLSSPLAGLMGDFAESTCALYMGDVKRCFDAIERALSMADSSGIHIWDKILLGQAAALALSHGELDRGRSYAQRRAAIVRPADNEEQSLNHLINAWSSWLNGNPAEALAHLRLLSGFTERMGLPHFNAIGLLSAAIVSFECGEQEAGLGQVEAGRVLGTATRNPMLVWMADLLKAYMRLRRGEDATALIQAGMAAGRKHGYRHFFFWPRKAIAVVCFRALELGIEPDYVKVLIEKGQLAAPPEALQSDRWPWPVKVLTLGTFSVVVHGVPVVFNGKAQRVPLNLLKVLIAYGGRDVAESEIANALWPDSEADAGRQTLGPTLHRLRELVGFDAIKRHDRHLSLAPTECWVDCWALEKSLASPVADATSLVQRVKHLYAGPFLSGQDDAPWALQLRERLHAAVVKKLAAVAADALAQGRIDLADEIYSAGLGIDDLAEEFYRGQIQCHIARDEPSLAVTSYRRCQRALLSRRGVEPSAATTRLYLSAIGASGK